MTTPLVSIICTTYNQEHYIRQTLDGFLAQKTSFPIEIIVHDDASTDNTPLIIKEYENRYPNLFRNIYREENWYSKGKNIWEYLFVKVARGKYIAICEGDDYWTDPNKLEKQVWYLEQHQEIIVCFHQVSIKNNNNIYSSKEPPKKRLTQKDLAKTNYINTCSVVFRNIVSKIDLTSLTKSKAADYILWILLSGFGDLYYTSDNMACYRIAANGSIWSSKSAVYQYKNWILTLKTAIKNCKKETKPTLYRQIIMCYIIYIYKYCKAICEYSGKK